MISRIYNILVSAYIILKIKLRFFINSKKSIDKIEVVVFSYNRPGQLYALLKSINKYINITDLKVHILYRCDDEKFFNAYQEVFRTEFKFIIVQHLQSTDFKKSLINLLGSVNSENILTFVDDQVLFREVAIPITSEANFDIYTLRIGKDTSYCYTLQKSQTCKNIRLSNNGLAWNVGFKNNDFNYPFSVDATFFNKNDFYFFAKWLKYNAPNSFEGAMNRSRLLSAIISTTISSPLDQAAVNIVLNKVQNENDNISLKGYSPDRLLKMWKENKYYGLDDEAVDKIKSPHIDFGFILRIR